MTDDLLDAADVAALLKVSKRTVERLPIPYLKLGRCRRMLYMGHSPSDVSALYEHHEVEGFLAEDAQRLRSWLAGQLPASVALPQLEGV